MMITLEDALSLLSKYSEESTRVLAVFVTPSLSVARVIGTLQVVIENGTPPRLMVGKEDIEADQKSSDLRIANSSTVTFVMVVLKVLPHASLKGF